MYAGKIKVNQSSALNDAIRKVPFFQARPTINSPGDAYGQEAGTMAHEAMGMPIHGRPLISPQPLSVSRLQRKCQHCEDEEKLDRKESTSQPAEADSDISSYVDSLSSKGSPLPYESRKFFEPRFGYDFSKVKIHNDNIAAKSAQSVNALAYTTGNNIVFNKNQFSPENDKGKILLAHELTHVVQQQLTNQNIQRDEIDEISNGGSANLLQSGQNTEIHDPLPLSSGRPVFFCSHSVALGGKHAFFRVGGVNPGNPTFELEHDEAGNHCPCGIQGIPTRDYPEDMNDSAAQCVSAPSITEACLIANWSTYPIGRYCALGPNSNTYARFLAERCGATGLRPPGWLPGFDDAPPVAGTASETSDARFTLVGCSSINCNNDDCLRQQPTFPPEFPF